MYWVHTPMSDIFLRHPSKIIKLFFRLYIPYAVLTVGLNMSTQRNAIKPLNISPNKITQSIMVMFCYRVWPVFTLIETNRKACSERPWVAAWILQTCFLSLSINKLFYCLFFIQMNTYKPIKFYLALKLNVTLYI